MSASPLQWQDREADFLFVLIIRDIIDSCVTLAKIKKGNKRFTL